MAATGRPVAFPWAAVLAHGLGRLRLSPLAFWAMTPREIAASFPPVMPAHQGPTAENLAALMARFPDPVLNNKDM